MSILIKGMDIPQGCFSTDGICFAYDGVECDCSLAPDKIIHFSTRVKNERPTWCPLVPIPPHGRLIDADALKARVQKLQERLWDKLTDADVGIKTADDIRYRIAEESEEFIDDAPTIIESEGEE